MSGTDAGNLRRPVCPGQRTRLDLFSIGIRNRFFTPPRTPALGEASCRQKQGPSPVGLVPPPNPEAVPVLAGRRPKAAWDRRCGAVVTQPLFPFARPPMIAPLFPETQCLAYATASGFGLDFRLLRGFFTGCRAARGCGFCAFYGPIASGAACQYRGWGDGSGSLDAGHHRGWGDGSGSLDAG